MTGTGSVLDEAGNNVKLRPVLNVPSHTPIDITELTNSVITNYANLTLSSVNDHVVKVSVMTESYH